MTREDLPGHISLQHQFPPTFVFQLQVLFLDQAEPRNLSWASLITSFASMASHQPPIIPPQDLASQLIGENKLPEGKAGPACTPVGRRLGCPGPASEMKAKGHLRTATHMFPRFYFGGSCGWNSFRWLAVVAHIQVKNGARLGALGFLGVSAAGRAEMGGQKEPEQLGKTPACQTCPKAIHISEVFSKLSPRHPSPTPRGLSLRTHTFMGGSWPSSLLWSHQTLR